MLLSVEAVDDPDGLRKVLAGEGSRSTQGAIADDHLP
jgi:hypothetical protein